MAQSRAKKGRERIGLEEAAANEDGPAQGEYVSLEACYSECERPFLRLNQKECADKLDL